MIDSRRQAGAGLWGDRTLHLKQAAQRRQPPTSQTHTNRQAAPIALRDGRYAASLIKSRAFRRPVPALSRPAFGPGKCQRACPASSRQPSRRRRFHEHACSNQPVDTRTPFTGPDSMSKQPSLSYKDAGVDIDAGEALVERIKGVAKRTARPDWAAWAASAPCAKSRQATSSPCWSPAPTASVPNCVWR